MATKNKPQPLKQSIWKKMNREKYAVVDSKGNVLEKFRQKNSATYWASQQNWAYPEKDLSVVSLKE